MWGLAEWADDGTFGDNNALWLLYSVNKEDMWISRVALPIKPAETLYPSDNFKNMVIGSYVPGWNIYSPDWAPVAIADDEGSSCLELKDADPFDNAHAVRLFPTSSKVRIQQEIKAAQTDAHLEIDLCDSIGGKPIHIALTDNGSIQAFNDTGKIIVGKYSAGDYITITIDTDLEAGIYTVQINDNEPIHLEIATKGIQTIERLSLRTGNWHGMIDNIEIDPALDIPDEQPSIFHVRSVFISPLK